MATALWLAVLFCAAAGAQANCCRDNRTGEDTTWRSRVPLHLAKRLQEGTLADVLSGVRDTHLLHPAFTTFIVQGNGSTHGKPLLGAARPAQHGLHSDLKEVDSERRRVIRDAACKPRKLPVPVPRPADPLVVYTPSCVMVPRCSGCCSHELLQCVPTKVRSIRKKVLALRFSGGDQVALADQEYSVKRVKMEKHVECACQCKVKASDCSPRQQYDAANCRCFCPNEHEASSCPGTKIWSDEDCACKCSKVEECSTGLTFDAVQCRCLPSRAQTLLFRAAAPRGPAAQSPPTFGWGSGMSSGVIVDRPAPTRRPRPTPAREAPYDASRRGDRRGYYDRYSGWRSGYDSRERFQRPGTDRRG